VGLKGRTLANHGSRRSIPRKVDKDQAGAPGELRDEGQP
jgi:hypothetical protein